MSTVVKNSKIIWGYIFGTPGTACQIWSVCIATKCGPISNQKNSQKSFFQDFLSYPVHAYTQTHVETASMALFPSSGIKKTRFSSPIENVPITVTSSSKTSGFVRRFPRCLARVVRIPIYDFLETGCPEIARLLVTVLRTIRHERVVVSVVYNLLRLCPAIRVSSKRIASFNIGAKGTPARPPCHIPADVFSA